MIVLAIAAIVFGGDRLAHEIKVLDGWHEFYLMAGTAAVTLVGLLFVSLSFNLDVLLHESRLHLLSHARETMLSFIYVLILALMFLVPGNGARMMGWSIVGASAVMLTVSVISIAKSRRLGGAEPHEKFLGRRRRLTVIGHLAAIFIGLAMALRRDPYQAYWMVAVVSMQIGNAAGSAWDLLVEVGKLKRRLETEKR